VTLFDLLFLVSFLVAVITLIVVAVAAVRGRSARAYPLLRRLAIGAAVYFGVLILVSAFTPQRFVSIGNDECSDDWCIAVQAVHRDSTSAAMRYDVRFQLASHARRIAQRERFVAVHLLDERGAKYAPASEPNDVPFDTLLQAGQTLTAVRRFVVPADTKLRGLVIERSGGGRFPRCCIIGDEDSFFHRRTMVKLN
jgi:hypothetical protein